MVSPKIRTDRFVAAEKILIQLHLLGSTPSRPVFDDLVTACRRHMSIASIDWGDDILPRTKKVEKLLTVISKWESLGSAGQRSTLEVCLMSYLCSKFYDGLNTVFSSLRSSMFFALSPLTMKTYSAALYSRKIPATTLHYCVFPTLFPRRQNGVERQAWRSWNGCECFYPCAIPYEIYVFKWTHNTTSQYSRLSGSGALPRKYSSCSPTVL